jgi:hypothetical protein
MGTAAKKPKPQRSKKSGIKTKKLVDNNLKILNKLQKS